MSAAQYKNVTINAQASISYDGRCSSHTIMFEDGRQKTLGVILPCDNMVEHYQFITNTSERIDIISGECEVQLHGEEDFSYYRAGQGFVVEGDSGFNLRTEEIVQYVCHLEG
ncbi:MULTISPECIES: pyrimidine/purine nucleoside phosphorylase [unclassified Psychrobacter]|uniref:pyrimidine/purine nucleoside phosphorylase n=1 Tax=unclassified Psychrobacter TaxID=196806 RepID=UPI0018F5E480|nr:MULTISPECIES: pyrimidine/purine nucleoside phosphorylase [unclassified Psychrobacter]